MARFVKAGTKVCIANVIGNARAKRSRDRGQCGVILEEGRIGPDAGWDVYDVRLASGRETFAHGFNLTSARKKR